MQRGSIWLGGTGFLLLGYFLGHATGGPTELAFPDPEEARDAAQMERAVDEALVEPRAFPRAGRLIRLFEGLSTDNVQGAARSVAARAGGWDPVDLQLFLTAWVHLDPLGAVREVEGWPIRSRRELGLKIVVREWAASGRGLEAAGYLQSISDPETFAVAAGPLVRGWALAGETQSALGLAHRLWNTGQKLDVVDGFVRGTIHAKGPDAALSMVSEIDPFGEGAGEFEYRLARVTLNLAGREDPPAAAEAYAELTQAGTPDWLAGSLDRMASLLRNEDPLAALEWLLQREASAERKKSLSETMATWAIRDFETAWNWFETERGPFDGTSELEPVTSTLLSGLIRKMARTRPAEAAQWVSRLDDPSDRQKMMIRVAHFWAKEDPTAAGAWIEGLGLPSAQTRQLEEAAERGVRNAAAGQETIRESPATDQ